MPASDGSPRALRQPEISREAPEAASSWESGGDSGVRASIPARWPITDLIATHLQLHLGIRDRRLLVMRQFVQSGSGWLGRPNGQIMAARREHKSTHLDKQRR